MNLQNMGYATLAGIRLLQYPDDLPLCESGLVQRYLPG